MARLLLVSMLFAAGLFVAVSQARGSFDAPVNFAVGGSTEFLATGDLDADGDLDLATANTTTSSVSILLGNGAGSFTTAAGSPITVGSTPRSVAIENLDAGSVPDLVVSNYGSNNVSVLLGVGDGTFTTAAESPIAVGALPRTVAIGNLNAGSVPDLAITNELSGTVSILLGDGDGTFTAAPGSPIAVGSSPYGIAVANLDGDGDDDLALGSSNSNIRVLLGNGDGTFNVGSPIPVSSVPQRVAIGNLNAGGVPDLVVVNRDDSNVSVLLGVGDGTFGAKTDFPTRMKPQSVVIGNLDSDSFPDLAVATSGPDTSGPDDVSVLLGNGDGTFGTKTDFQAGIDPLSIAIGNLNGGGSPDLMTANAGGSDVSVLLKTTGPTANLSPDRLDFALQELATTSPARTVTVTNTSDDDQVEVGEPTITAQDSSAFEVSSETCSATPLQPTDTCLVNVTFTPVAAGQRFSNLEISFNGAASPLTVQLSGTGAKARIGKLRVSGPATIRKGKPATYRAKITNTGNARATGVRVVASGRGIRSSAPAVTIGAGATRSVSLRIRPSRIGRIKASFKVTSSNAGTKTVRKTVRVR
jgi:hypothetical protein